MKTPKRIKKVRNILSFSTYGHSVVFLTEKDRMPNFFWPSTFCIICIYCLSFGGFLLYFCLLIVTFFKVSESESLQGQNPPICKRKKPALNRPVRKRRKTTKLIEEAPLVSLISDDEDAEFVGGPIIKKSKEKKKG